jgi:hypothetical protein
MKLIEAMKKIKVIEKRIVDQTAKITEYAAKPSNEKPVFETEEKQKKEVKSLLQSNEDLLNDLLTLKTQVEYTNLVTKIEIDGKNFSISEMLVLKRKGAQLMKKTYEALNTTMLEHKIRNYSNQSKDISLDRFYSEDEKNINLSKWQSIYDNIDSRLEVVNATIDLIENIPA